MSASSSPSKSTQGYKIKNRDKIDELARQLNISGNKAINNLIAIPDAAPMGTHADKNNPYKWRLLDEAPITSTKITRDTQTSKSDNPQGAIEPGSFGYIDQSAEVNHGEGKHNEDKHKDDHQNQFNENRVNPNNKGDIAALGDKGKAIAVDENAIDEPKGSSKEQKHIDQNTTNIVAAGEHNEVAIINDAVVTRNGPAKEDASRASSSSTPRPSSFEIMGCVPLALRQSGYKHPFERINGPIHFPQGAVDGTATSNEEELQPLAPFSTPADEHHAPNTNNSDGGVREVVNFLPALTRATVAPPAYTAGNVTCHTANGGRPAGDAHEGNEQGEREERQNAQEVQRLVNAEQEALKNAKRGRDRALMLGAFAVLAFCFSAVAILIYITNKSTKPNNPFATNWGWLLAGCILAVSSGLAVLIIFLNAKNPSRCAVASIKRWFHCRGARRGLRDQAPRPAHAKGYELQEMHRAQVAEDEEARIGSTDHAVVAAAPVPAAAPPPALVRPAMPSASLSRPVEEPVRVVVAMSPGHHDRFSGYVDLELASPRPLPQPPVNRAPAFTATKRETE